jgi:hypothetical protein
MNMSYWIAGKTSGGKYLCLLVTGTSTAKQFVLDKANSPPEASSVLDYRTRIPLEELSGTRKEAIGKALAKLNAEHIRLSQQIQKINDGHNALKSLLES